jgi:creatinine amidohydrolase
MNCEFEIDLSKAAYGYVRGKRYDIAILPWGATEPHNLHLPYLTDSILSYDVAVDAARIALDKYGVRAMVLPSVMMGAQNPGQRDLPFCIHYREDTQRAILTDIVASLAHQAIRKLLIVNGHGGNSFKGFIRDLAVDYPDFIILSSEWFTVLPAKQYFDEPGDHADELETSVMMHYHPELVRLEDAGPGKARAFALPTLQQKVAWLPRHWTQVTDDTGIGNPHLATADKGRRFAEAVAEKYAQLLSELSSVRSVSDLYEHPADQTAEKHKMLSGEVYQATDPALVRELNAVKDVLHRYNSLQPSDREGHRAILYSLFGHIADDKAFVIQPFHCDYGKHISVGKRFFANFNFTVLDEAPVTIGDDCFIGPNVSIFTACHSTDPDERNTRQEWARPVRIGNNVWIGGDVTILPGVTIGNGVTIGAGSVVVSDIPDGSIAVGNPCKVVKSV